MGFEYRYRLILTCDSCGVSEDYGEEYNSANYREHPPSMPTGWEMDYADGDSIFDAVCGECIESFEEKDDESNS